MSITDRQRTELHRAAEEAMGPEPADSLMALLPPVGWADVATKHDLSELERRLDLRFEKLDLRFEALEDRLTARFDSLDPRFDSLEARLTARFDSLDPRFEALDPRFDSLEARLTARFESAMRTYFVALLSSLAILLGIATAVTQQLSG